MNERIKYCGFVGIFGRPNVGKSSLFNSMLQKKISITSKRPETTRYQILGIYTEGVYQVIYLDTPGLYIDLKYFTNRLVNRVTNSVVEDVNLLIFMVEATRWTKEDELILNRIRKKTSLIILLINKIDKIKNKAKLLPYIYKLSKKMDFLAIIPISVLKRENLCILKTNILKYLPKAEHYFPKNYQSDSFQEFILSELIREKLMRFLWNELPYLSMVKIERFVSYTNGNFGVDALIIVERETQKKILIGKNGIKIKKIGIEARKDMRKILGGEVYLDVWVKVKSNWSDDKSILHVFSLSS